MELIDAMSLLFSDSGFDMLVYLDSGAQKILLSFGYEAFHYPQHVKPRICLEISLKISHASKERRVVWRVGVKYTK